jgi:23S rRNA (uracil1939-C5)-methyltransferase
VPFALPGELVSVIAAPDSDRAGLIAVLEPSPERIAPICPHFGICGGCPLQHLEEGAYLAWKRELVVAALRSRGLEAEVEPVRPVPLANRRRAALALASSKQGVALGYRRARSHELIDIEVCPILSPRIVDRLPKLKQALAPLLGGKREARVGVTETESGLDIVRRRQAKPRIAWRLCRQSRLARRGAPHCGRRKHRVSPHRRSICRAPR